MKQKQKKKQNVNNKFNFDDEYIIGVSNSESLNKKSKNNKNSKNSKSNRNNKNYNSKSKAKVKAKTKVNKVTKIFISICLFAGAGCFFCLSPIFNVQEIIVEKNNKVPADTIRSLSRIELYKNIFLINKSDVIDNIEENSYINDVKVQRLLPNKIRVSVEERTEKYLLQFAEGKYTVLDGQGYILRVTNELEQLTLITGAETNIEDLIKIKGNKNRLCEADLKKLDNVSKIVQTSQNYEVLNYITRIDISDADNIKLMLDGEGKIVHLGSCNDINTRILYMKEILNTEKGKSGEIFVNGNLSEDKVFFRENV